MTKLKCNDDAEKCEDQGHTGTSLDVIPDQVTGPMFGEANPKKRISSSFFDVCFVPIKGQIKLGNYTDEDILKISQGHKPWGEIVVTKPYWENRQYSELHIGIFGALPNTDDRHYLDTIIASGLPLRPAMLVGATVRDILWAWDAKKRPEFHSRDALYRADQLPVNIPYEFLYEQTKNALDTQVFSGSYVYLIIAIKDLGTLFGTNNITNCRDLILDSLSRLALTTLKVSQVGKTGRYNTNDVKFIDSFIYPFVDTANITNMRNVVQGETCTHILLGVGQQYHASLKKDSTIPREKLLNDYTGFRNDNHIVDFVKFLERNGQGFFKGWIVIKVIKTYLEEKVVSTFAVNKKKSISKKANAMLKSIVGDKSIIKRIEYITRYTIADSNRTKSTDTENNGKRAVYKFYDYFAFSENKGEEK